MPHGDEADDPSPSGSGHRQTLQAEAVGYSQQGFCDAGLNNLDGFDGIGFCVTRNI